MPKGLTTGIIYVPLDVRWPRNRKVRPLIVRHGIEGLAAWSLYLAMACYCRENLSDGWVPAEEIGALAYPLPPEQAEQLVKLLADYRLVSDPHSEPHSKPHSEPDSEPHSDRHSEPDSRGYLVRAYVKRNGTRADALDQAVKFAEAGRAGGLARWSEGRYSPGYSDGHSGGLKPAATQTESETETSSAPTSGRAPAPARAGARDDDDDDEELTQVQALMVAAGRPVGREDAAKIRAAVLAKGGNIRNRRAFIGRVLGDPKQARAYAPGAGHVATAREIIDSARHRGGPSPDVEAQAADARKQLANRERPAAADAEPPETAPHEEALARAQLADARAARLPDTPAAEPLPADPDWQPPF